MAEDKNGFLLYKDLIHSVKKLPKEKAGELFLHILEYVNDHNPETDDLLIELAFEPVKQSLKRDLKKYEKTKEKNRENALKRWQKPQSETMPINATASDRMPTDAKHADSDIDNGSDSVSDTDNDILLEKETKEIPPKNLIEDDLVNPETEQRKKVAQKKESFKPPDPIDVQDYCDERQNGINGQYFCDFYASKGWKVGNQKMIDWKAAVRTWEQKNKINGNTNNAISGFNTNKNGNGKVSGTQNLIDGLEYFEFT